MRTELRVCKHCYEGEHGYPEKADVTRDVMRCGRRVREYKDLIGLTELHITMVEEGEPAGAEALPVVEVDSRCHQSSEDAGSFVSSSVLVVRSASSATPARPSRESVARVGRPAASHPRAA